MQGSGGEGPAACNCGKDDELAGGNPALASHAATARYEKNSRPTGCHKMLVDEPSSRKNTCAHIQQVRSSFGHHTRQ